MAKTGQSTQKTKSFHHELISQMIVLSTSGFGFVTALAWNEAIQTLVTDSLQTYFPDHSSLISKFLYAIFITFFAVFITYQLSRLASRWGIKK